jgi:hypothetical protein
MNSPLGPALFNTLLKIQNTGFARHPGTSCGFPTQNMHDTMFVDKLKAYRQVLPATADMINCLALLFMILLSCAGLQNLAASPRKTLTVTCNISGSTSGSSKSCSSAIGSGCASNQSTALLPAALRISSVFQPTRAATFQQISR